MQVYGSTFADYKKKYDELWLQGWRIYILQSYVTSDGKVLYNAVWRQGIYDEEQVYGYSFADYKKEYDKLWPKGWRLYILHSYVMPNNEILYNAVWRKGDLGENQIYAFTYKQFQSQYDQFFNEKSRLESLQSYVVNGQVSYNAVWGTGTSEEEHLFGKPYANFKKKYDKLWHEGWRLYLLQSYVMPKGHVLYNAVWRPGNMPETQLYGVNFAEYQKEYDKLWSQGWRLYILDTYITEKNEVLYNAIWRLGVCNRPL